MPSINRVINNIQSIRYSTPSLNKMYENFTNKSDIENITEQIDFKKKSNLKKFLIIFENIFMKPNLVLKKIQLL